MATDPVLLYVLRGLSISIGSLGSLFFIPLTLRNARQDQYFSSRLLFLAGCGSALLALLHAPLELAGIAGCYFQAVFIQMCSAWTVIYWGSFFVMLWLLATNRVTRDSLGGGRWREPLFHFGAAGITALLTIIPVAGYGLSAPAGSVVQGEWCWVVWRFGRLRAEADRELDAGQGTPATTPTFQLAPPVVGPLPQATALRLPSRRELILVRTAKEQFSLYLLAFALAWIPFLFNRLIELGGAVVEFFLGLHAMALPAHGIWQLVAYGRLRSVQPVARHEGSTEEKAGLLDAPAAPATPLDSAPPPPVLAEVNLPPAPPPLPLPAAIAADIAASEGQFAAEISELREGEAHLMQRAQGDVVQLTTGPPSLDDDAIAAALLAVPDPAEAAAGEAASTEPGQ